MCNRYASDIRKAGLERDYYGFEEWSETRINTILEVFPKSVGPVIIRNAAGQLEWRSMRWGLPGPSSTGGAPVTNIRNVSSPHWRNVLGPERRCVVPFTAFSEYEDSSPNGAKVIRWFAPVDQPMAFFAGVWRAWTGDYGSKKKPNVGEHSLFSFLTTDANDLVRPVHAKAMPVILRTKIDVEDWLSAPSSDVPTVQSRTLPKDALRILDAEESAVFSGAYIK